MGAVLVDESTSQAEAFESRSLTAERVVLSQLIKHGEVFDKIRAVIHSDDFLNPFHRELFAQIEDSVAIGDPLEASLLAEKAAAKCQMDYPGLQYVRKLVGMTDGEGSVERYAKVVLEHSLSRQLAVRTGRAFERLRSGGADLHAELGSLLAECEALSERLQPNGSSSFGSIARFTVEAMGQLDANATAGQGSNAAGVRTGFDVLDQELLGLQRGDLVVLAGRPSMGKTSLAMNIAEHVAAQESLPVAVFSLEMSGAQLALRMLSGQTGIDSRKLRTGDLSDREWTELTQAAESTSQACVWIDESPERTLNDIRRRARELQTKVGRLGLIVIDYMQLLTVPNSSSRETRASQVAELSRGLKSIAKELDAPVLALSQLNRSLELRPDKRPIMSDLRESGAIEQDADVIAFVYRDEVYNANSPHPGVAEVIIAKQRNGPVGVVRLGFDKQRSAFRNLAR